MDFVIILYDPSIFMYVTAAGFVFLCSLEVYSLCYLVDSLKDVVSYTCRFILTALTEINHIAVRTNRRTHVISMCSATVLRGSSQGLLGHAGHPANHRVVFP